MEGVQKFRGYSDPQIAWHLARFIENVRSATLDPVLMRRDWLSAYDFTTERGARFLGDYARSADPFAHVGERTVSVQVISVVRASDRSFQVKWTEAAYQRGSPDGISHWTGILTLVTKVPTSADVLRKNPLGIYIDAIDWSRELEPPPSPAAKAASASSQAAPVTQPVAAPATIEPTLNPEIQP